MTDLEAREYVSMLKSPLDQSTISDSMDEYTSTKSSKNIPLNFVPKYLTKVITNSVSCGTNLNFSTGRAADVARRLIHDHDIYGKPGKLIKSLHQRVRKPRKSLKMPKS